MIDPAVQKRFQVALNEACIPSTEQARFWPLLARFLAGDRGFVCWEEIQKLTIGDPELIPYGQATSSVDKAQDCSDLAVVKLNGGLGTGMGLEGPKTLLKVTRDESFLSIIIGQMRAASAACGTPIPLILMNSFSTAAETQSALNVMDTKNLPILHMNQGTFLRIATAQKENGALSEMEPAPLPKELAEDRFNPPGHGDVYNVLRDSGILDRLRKEGRRYLFISNGDNLGATPDPRILAYIRANRIPFLLEVTERSANDVKGGTVAKRKNTSTLKLLELVNVPAEHQAEFQDITQFPVFNTNSLWVDTDALSAQLARGPLAMDLIVNPKVVGNTHVVQLEQAMGSAISSFPGAVAMVVPRKRFRPVKSTNELFLLRSNLFAFARGEFSAVSDAPLPFVSLGAEFKKIADFEARVPEVPDLSGLRSLKVSGNVFFGPGIALEGDVEIKADATPTKLPAGTLLRSGVHIFAAGAVVTKP